MKSYLECSRVDTFGHIYLMDRKWNIKYYDSSEKGDKECIVWSRTEIFPGKQDNMLQDIKAD